MAIDGTKQVASGKYLPVIDNNGVDKYLGRPNNKSIIGFDGDDIYWMDGSDDRPLNFLNMKENTGQLTHILGVLGNGRVFRYTAPNDVRRVLTCEAGVVSWSTQSVIGIPSTGFGLLTRPSYVQSQGVDVPTPVFLHTEGLVYMDVQGQPGTIGSGTNGQQLTLINGVPAWTSASTGSVGGGAASVGMSGVVAGNTSASTVNVRLPSITVVNSIGTEVKVSNVNVSANLAASIGVGGLDIGAENPNTWYYLYVVSDGSGSVGAVISQNSNAPDLTNLGVNVYSALASVFRNDASSNIVTFAQRGRDFYLIPMTVSDFAAVGTTYTPMPVNTPLNSVLPPSVKKISGVIGGSGSSGSSVNWETGNVQMQVAADVNGLAAQMIPVITFAGWDGFRISAGNFFDIPILDPISPVIYWRATTVSSKRKTQITGYSI